MDLIKKKLFWNTFIRSSLQAYIKVLFVYLTLLLALDFSNFSSGVKSMVVVIIVTVLFALPPIYIAILHKKRAILGNLAVKDKIGSLYLGVRIQNPLEYLYSPIFLIRRLVYIALLIALQAQPVLFLICLIHVNILYLCYNFTVQPHKSKSAALQETINEIFFQLITYCVTLTSWRNFFKILDPKSDEYQENNMTILFDRWLGQCAIGLVVCLQIFNLIVIIGVTIKDLRHKLRLKRIQMKQE